jgi:hypothetical protein
MMFQLRWARLRCIRWKFVVWALRMGGGSVWCGFVLRNVGRLRDIDGCRDFCPVGGFGASTERCGLEALLLALGGVSRSRCGAYASCQMVGVL